MRRFLMLGLVVAFAVPAARAHHRQTPPIVAITTAGDFSAPPASNAFMFMLGGGVQVPLVPHWVADAGYRFARIAADSTLSASPLNANSVTFGVGYRF